MDTTYQIVYFAIAFVLYALAASRIPSDFIPFAVFPGGLLMVVLMGLLCWWNPIGYVLGEPGALNLFFGMPRPAP